MTYKLVVFDWDGTLMDSASKIVQSMQLAAKNGGVPVPSDFAVRQIIGISLKPAIMRLFDLQDERKADDLVQAYKEAYLTLDHIASPLFEGVHGLLEQLSQQNKRLAVATGKARRGLSRAWQATDTGQYFVTSRCADEAESKPSPDMLKQILSEQGVAPEEAVMIGDTSFDMAMAQAIGMDRIGVSYGVHEIQQLEAHSPKAIVHRVEELVDWL